jgi:signal transduction histidine kinase
VLAVLPLATLAVFAVQARGLISSLARKRYGARLKLKLSLIFMGIVLISSLPPTIFSVRLVSQAAERMDADALVTGVERGITVLGKVREGAQRRLEALSLRVLPGVLNANADLARALAAMQSIDPGLEALELFAADGSRRGAGPAAARLSSPPLGGSTGALPTETGGGATRLRYAITWRGSTAVLCLRLAEGFEEAAASLTRASRQAREAQASSALWPRHALLALALFLLPLLLLALLVGIAAADFIVEPLAGLEEATKRIAAGEVATRILAKPGDERGWLMSSFNRMLDELETLREGDLIQERVDAWRDLAQRLAHELKNPLTPIRLAAERLLRMGRSDPQKALAILEGSTLAIIAEVDSMDSLLGDFRAFARLPTPQKEWISLAELIEDSVAMFRASYPEVDFAIGSLPPDTRLHADRAMLRRALGNLISNSIEAMQGRGRISLSADLVKAGDSGYCRLRLGDSGGGIPADIRDRIFTPYFTTKEKGTGLGLAIVERIIHDHDGRIRFESSEGVGTVFWLDLPVDRDLGPAKR